MSFQQGLSGLNAASKSLDVTGNNIANANTVGFKQSRAEFADVYANSLNGGGSNTQIGIGTKVATIQTQFTQGNITNTTNSLDLAINGGGFFRLNNNGTVIYSRNGQFQLNKDGYIVNASGDHLTGYTADAAGNLSTGAPADLFINTANLPASASTTIDAVVNLDARTAVNAAVFNATDPTTYDQSTSVTVFDSLGNPHTVQNFYTKTAPGTWKVNTTIDGSSTVTAGSPATLSFNTSGIATGATTQNVAFTAAGAANVSITLDYAGSTQFGSIFSVNSLAQNGYTSGQLSKFTTSADGTIVGSYTNGQTKVLGQVNLVNFANPNGLVNLGNNTYAESSASGVPVAGTPGTASLGVLQSNALEDANVDLTAELVNLITAQRYYQANAQTIKTEDQIQQTLVNLR
ncbi:flagellar hook protein FlgE [Methyloradius palustris]|uniref:Flagellar hook protein FlgE n=1 Tax=Methyloradius palustris TaxID=2778876 RepID=A0A8D5GDI0_9PROT|nr:flagellar hook protein FlgE [Methyloradius palustris]BCM25458.1 flagellar hook protein FlgE [Methyloradius palustris]